jgi:hypothetical protein
MQRSVVVDSLCSLGILVERTTKIRSVLQSKADVGEVARRTQNRERRGTMDSLQRRRLCLFADILDVGDLCHGRREQVSEPVGRVPNLGKQIAFLTKILACHLCFYHVRR